MKDNKKKNIKAYVGDAMSKTIKFAFNANDLALAKTEQIVTDSIEITSQWQKVAETAIKGGLKLSLNQQDLVFDVLNAAKSDLKEGKKKLTKLVS